MCTVGVRDQVMIAHSFAGEVFAAAQRLHGAAYVVDAPLGRAELDANGAVVDKGRAQDTLRTRLARLANRNLDEVAEFRGSNITTDVRERWVFDELARALGGGELGDAARESSSLRVTLHESHVARAAYPGHPHTPTES